MGDISNILNPRSLEEGDSTNFYMFFIQNHINTKSNYGNETDHDLPLRPNHSSRKFSELDMSSSDGTLW